MRPIQLSLFCLLVALPSSLASAESMNYEQATTLLSASCSKDINDYCRGVNLDAAGLKDCLNRNADSISPQCKTDFPRAIGSIEQRVTARVGLMKLCNWEMNHLCGEVRQDPARGLQCLLDSAKKNTPNCNKAIDAAGYR
jgi:hypothetical protein